MKLVGVSFDAPDKNKLFATQNGFPFPLLSDVDRVAGAAYETMRAPEERFPDQAKRRTYVIDPEGRIARAYRVGDVASHADEVLADLGGLVSSS